VARNGEAPFAWHFRQHVRQAIVKHQVDIVDHIRCAQISASKHVLLEPQTAALTHVSTKFFNSQTEPTRRLITHQYKQEVHWTRDQAAVLSDVLSFTLYAYVVVLA